MLSKAKGPLAPRFWEALFAMQEMREASGVFFDGSPVAWSEHVTDEEYGAAPAIER